MKTKFAFTSPIYLLPFCFLLGVSFTAFYVNSSKANEEKQENNRYFNLVNQNKYKAVRMGGFDYIRPLLFVDDVNESLEFLPLKQKIKAFIDKYKVENGLRDASVYLNTFTKGWMSFNEDGKFHAGNFNVIPLMMAYLKMSEIDSKLLNRQLDFVSNAKFATDKISLSKPQIEPGTKYSIK